MSAEHEKSHSRRLQINTVLIFWGIIFLAAGVFCVAAPDTILHFSLNHNPSLMLDYMRGGGAAAIAIGSGLFIPGLIMMAKSQQ
jgi:hypothetical protein